MKRLLSVLLVVSMFLSFAVPAAAEQADTVTSCGKTENCTLTEAHEGDCVLPQPEACSLEEGCILEAGHEGDCQQTQMLMMLDGSEDPEPDPQTNLPEEAGLYFVSGETYIKELTVTANTAAEALLMYFDGTALTAAADYAASEGLIVAVKEDVTGGVLITAAAAGSYTITCGESTVTVTAAEAAKQPPAEPVDNGNPAAYPEGLYIYHNNTYTKRLELPVSTAPTTIGLYYSDGTQMTPATNAIRASDMLSCSHNGSGEYSVFTPAVGEHTVTYDLGDKFYQVTIAGTAATTGMLLCDLENNVLKVKSSVTQSVNGSVFGWLYCNGNKIDSTDELNALTYDKDAISITKYNESFYLEINVLKAGNHAISSGNSSITVTGTQGPMGLFFQVMQDNGTPGYINSTRMNIGFSMTSAFYLNGAQITMEEPGWIVYRVVTGENNQETATVDPSGLSMTFVQGGKWKLSANKSGKWQLGLPNETARITITVEARNLNLEGPLEAGLYAGINENNRYKYVSQSGLFHQGTMIFPLVFSNGGDVKRALTNLDLASLTWPSDGISLEYCSDGFWKAETLKAGKHPITYTDTDGKTYQLLITVQVKLPLYAQTQENGPWLPELEVIEGEPTQVRFAFQSAGGDMIPVEGTVNGSNELIEVTRNMTTKKFTVTVNDWGGTYYANYFIDDITCYTMRVRSREAHRLAMVDLNSANRIPVFDFIGEVGKPIQANFLFGRPFNTGLNDLPSNAQLTASSGLELTKNEKASGYTLKIKETGDHTVTYQDADGKTYTVHITGMPASDGNNMLFALQGNSSAPQFTSVLCYGQIQDLRLCYGTFSNYVELTADQLTKVVGTSVDVSQNVNQNGSFVCLQYSEPGQTLLQYKVGDITHNYVVKCYGDYMEMLQTEYSEQGHRFTVNIPYNGSDITVGFAWCNGTKMVMTGGNTFNEPADSPWPVTEEYVVGAMYAGPGHSVVAPAPKDFYDSIKGMSLNFLSIRNTVANPKEEPNGTLSKANNTPWNGRTIWSSKFQGTPGLYFDSSMLMTFDITLENETNRFYRTGELNYRPLPSQAAEVNIKDLKVLNTILSNSYVLINYLKDNVEGFTYDGGDLTLTLPAGNYNGILVSQILLPGSTDVLGTFRIQGSSEKGGTTVGGIYSKGFLHGVSNLNFHAMGNNSRITFDGETFTCGLFVNNTPTDFQPEFDFQTLWKYHPDFMRLSQKDAEEKFKTYNPSVPTESNSYNLGSITDCTFKGYDYAMRTDKGGFVQGSSGCTIEQCKYGVYINAGGMDTLHTDGRANTIWRNNRFIKNWMPVCITGLPNDLSPYYIRFIDNTFEKNRGDFWISFGDQDDQYYFQRNYYSGSWNDNYMPEEGWVLTDSDFWNTARSVTDPDTDTARAAMIVPGNAVVVTNPCRSQSDSTENLLIFDTDDQQHTSIFQSDADTMLVDPDSIGKLSRDLEIPVLNSEGKTVGSWTIEGGK